MYLIINLKELKIKLFRPPKAVLIFVIAKSVLDRQF